MSDVAKRPTLTTAWIVEGPDGVRLRKAESASQQLPEDPFSYARDSGESGLVRPLYDLDQLASMLEANTLHARCAKQKATDVAGRGFEVRVHDDVAEGGGAADEARWAAFVESVEEDARGDESFTQRIVQAHQDYESIGWAVLEVGRDSSGMPDGLWHVPSHTVRAHADGRRFAQKRGGKTVWFKRYGIDGTVDKDGGAWTDRTVRGDWTGNELIVIRNYTPRSSYYGLPDHIPALSAIAGWRAQADFNIRFFDNNAVPSYAVVVEGADISPALEETILDHFRQIKADPHRTIVIPIPGIPGDEATQPKLRFEKLSNDVKDASFRLYKQDNALEICISHGVPPYRVGWPIVGSLGGSTAEEMTEIYNDSIVQPRQETWEQRLNRALLGSKGLGLTTVSLKALTLDTSDQTSDIAMSQALYEMNALTPAAIARFYNLEERTDDAGQLYRDQLEASQATPAPSFGAAAGAPDPVTAALLAKHWTEEVQQLTAIRKRLGELIGAGEAAA
jgi:PBSX family phage portal protein